MTPEGDSSFGEMRLRMLLEMYRLLIRLLEAGEIVSFDLDGAVVDCVLRIVGLSRRLHTPIPDIVRSTEDVHRKYFGSRFRRKVLVAMPSGDGLDAVWQDVLRPAIENAGYEPDLIQGSKSAFDKAINGICGCRAVTVDVTGVDPDLVFYVGYAYARNKPCMVITQSIDELPLNVRVIGATQYENGAEGEGTLTEAVGAFLAHLSSEEREYYGRLA